MRSYALVIISTRNANFTSSIFVVKFIKLIERIERKNLAVVVVAATVAVALIKQKYREFKMKLNNKQ